LFKIVIFSFILYYIIKMAGGLMQLVTYGSHDVYLTGNPQITFFKIVYRRHTNFAMECIEQVLNGGTPKAGGINTCTISNSGDLVHDIWIEDKARTGSHGDIYKYIDNVEVDIGGQVIDKQHGDWNAIWWNLTTPESKVGGLEECFMGNINVEGGENDRFFWYPLNFWFCRNVGSAVPLIALQYNEMKLKINWGSVSTVSPKAIVLVDYICLDTDERRRFAQISHEYLIEQVQRIHGPADTDNINLNFDHPVKELIWVNDMTAPASSTGATCKFGAMKDPVRYYVGDQLKCKIQFNGEDRISYRPSRYFKVIQPLKYHTRVPGEWGPVKQRLEVIGDGQPVASGDPKIEIASNTTVRIGHYSWLKDVLIVEDTVELMGLTPPTTVSSGNNDSTIRSIHGDVETNNGSQSIAPGGLTAVTDSGDLTGNANQLHINAISDPKVTAGNTYGIEFNTTSYSGSSITIDLILHKIKYREAKTLIAGNKDQSSGIYLYSFALKPEEHQPSGTCNFSRLDNAKLICSGGNFGLATNTYKIFAVNYNVLRIMSGMAGLAYSN